jgi:sulfide dehydrogenase cytochrome subunit
LIDPGGGREPPPSLIGRRMLFRRTAAAVIFLVLAQTAAAASLDAPPGASSCSGCHPVSAAVATPVPRLLGRDPAAIVVAMQEFRSGQRPTTVMDRIAKGFSEDETKAIAAWLGAQKD